MKNIRKIVAILAAVLMFCSALPMSAFAAEGDVVASIDWNDGELKFDKGEIAAGPDGSNCYKWTATGGWSATYMVLRDMDPAKDYTITMKAKATVNGNMGITIQNGDWGSYWNAPAFAVTTEWTDVVYALPAGSIPFAAGSILFKFQDTGVAMDLYIDDFVVSEGLPKKPLCENGDFESGAEGWTLEQSTVIDAAAAHSGNYGAHLIGGVNWNTMLDRTFDVVAGKNYELSYWAKVVSGGTNIKYLDQNWQGASLADGGWFNKTEWTQITVPFTAISDKFYFQFCGAGDMSTEMYVDDVKLIEIKDPSFDGYIYNGDFETGKTDHWTNLWGSSNIELVAGMNGDYALKGTANGAWNIVYQEVNVTPNTNYTVWAYAKDAVNSALWIKNAGGNGDITSKNFAGGSDWALTSVTFNSGSNEKVWIGLMGLEAGGTYTVDDIFMFEAKEASNDGYIINGDFETGSVSPWDNLWGSCPTVEIIKGGKDDNFALNLVSSEWKHLRQTNIAVEANTDYKVSAWAKNVKDMALLVKDNADTGNILNQSFSTGDEWTYVEYEFNTGDNTAILFSLMGCTADACGIFDNIVMEKVEAPVCEHQYFDACSPICEICGEEREVSHNIVHVEAVAPTCTDMGNIEYWFCDVCGAAWLDAECTMNTNLRAVKLAATEHTYDNDCDVDCNVCGTERTAPHSYLYACDKYCNECGEKTNPRAKHTIVHVDAKEATCQEDGNIEYWYCSDCNHVWIDEDCTIDSNMKSVATFVYHDLGGAPECQDAVCATCGETIEGFGCISDAPICQDGLCIYCGEDVVATAECEYGEDGLCIYCGEEESADAEIIYGDADGDGEVTNVDVVLLQQYTAGWDVEINEISGDADGDGEITNVDVVLVQQYTAGWDVTLGPADEDPILFNDGELGEW